jgi:glutaredoxin-related protein
MCSGKDGEKLQATLQSVTGRGTVPQVFVGGKFVGGCDGKFLDAVDTHCITRATHDATCVLNIDHC